MLLNPKNPCSQEQENQDFCFIYQSENVNPEQFKFNHLIGLIQDIVVNQQFQALNQQFMQPYAVRTALSFQNDELLQIFSHFRVTIGDFLENELKKQVGSFDLKEFVESSGFSSACIEQCIHELLQSVAYFQSFKHMFLEQMSEIELRQQLIHPMQQEQSMNSKHPENYKIIAESPMSIKSWSQ